MFVYLKIFGLLYKREGTGAVSKNFYPEPEPHKNGQHEL
jgi:hypothetical protein